MIAARTAAACKALAREHQDGDNKTGNNLEIWKGWEERKVDVMRIAVRLKFDQHPDLREKLRATGTAKLVEDSPVDMFWGGALPGSRNMAAEILMEYRSTL